MTQITYYAYTKYALRQQLHQSLARYDVAYKQSTKSFLTETIGQKDTARDKVTKVIEWVARYWTELPDEALEQTAQYIQQDFNKTEQQYQQGRKHGKKDDEGDATPVEPEA